MCVSCVTLQVHLYIFVCLNLTWDSIRNQSARCGLHEARTRSAWGRKKEKNSAISVSFSPPLVCHATQNLSEGLQWSLCRLPLNRLTFLEMFYDIEIYHGKKQSQVRFISPQVQKALSSGKTLYVITASADITSKNIIFIASKMPYSLNAFK